MLILSSDTCTKSISAAVFEDGKVLASFSGDKGMTHSQTHMLLIEDVLSKSGKNINQIDFFACTNGPGSYTGIRIGVTTTKALAYASGKDAVGVSSLEVLAYAFINEDALVCPMLDARNKRVFAAGFFKGDLLLSEGNYFVYDFCEKIKEYEISCDTKIKKVIFCGDAAGKYFQDSELQTFLGELSADNKTFEFHFFKTDPDAADLAKIVYEKYSSKITPGKCNFSPFLLNAKYLSPSSAERLKKKKKEGTNNQ